MLLVGDFLIFIVVVDFPFKNLAAFRISPCHPRRRPGPCPPAPSRGASPEPRPRSSSPAGLSRRARALPAGTATRPRNIPLPGHPAPRTDITRRETGFPCGGAGRKKWSSGFITLGEGQPLFKHGFPGPADPSRSVHPGWNIRSPKFSLGGTGEPDWQDSARIPPVGATEL